VTLGKKPFKEDTMLVLSRKIGEAVIIGDRIVVTVSRVSGNRVVLGIEAPSDVRVLRSELTPIGDSFPAKEQGHSANRDRVLAR
jgi:carbon storage regulator